MGFQLALNCRFPCPQRSLNGYRMEPGRQGLGFLVQLLPRAVVVQHDVRPGRQRRLGQLGVQPAAGHLGADAVPGHDPLHAHFIGGCDHDQAVPDAVDDAAHQHRPVDDKEGAARLQGRLAGGFDPADDGRVGDGVQGGLALGGGKGPVGQQPPVQNAVPAQNVAAEARSQLRQHRGAGLQHLPGDLVGVGHRHPVGRKAGGHGGLAASAAAGDAYRHHSATTRNAAARIRRLYTAMETPSFRGQRA